MKHLGKRILALLLVGVWLLTASGTAFAREREVPSVRVYADGLLTGRGFRSGEVVYLSVADVCAFLGLEADEQYDRTTHRVSVEADGLSLSAEAGINYREVNGRYLLLLKGILVVEGRPYFPVEMIEKIFNLRAEITPEKDRVELNLREVSSCAAASTIMRTPTAAKACCGSAASSALRRAGSPSPAWSAWEMWCSTGWRVTAFPTRSLT